MIWKSKSLIWIALFSIVTVIIFSNEKTQGTIRNYHNSEDIQCLSEAIYFEAGIESSAGKLAVGHVIINRVKSNKFPNTICEVVRQGQHHKNGVPKLNRCQFSYYCDGKSEEIRSNRLWGESVRVASYIANGRDYLLDITDDATFYHADYINLPYWATRKTRTAKIDRHIFYR